MPISAVPLATLADTFVSAMTNVRGRHIRRPLAEGVARILGMIVVDARDVPAADREALAASLRGLA
jgi:hypothetical protein